MRTILIGLDGLRPDCLLYSNSKNLKKLLKNSKCYFTFETQNKTSNLSGPSWASILSGKKISLLDTIIAASPII